MVVISEAYLQHIEYNAVQQALTINIAPITFKRYVDDCHARFSNSGNAESFLTLLNSQDKAIQYTCEYQNDQDQLNFLDICISTNHITHKYNFSIYRKNPITNVLVKPQSQNGYSQQQLLDIVKHYKPSQTKSRQQFNTFNIKILPWVPKLSLILRRAFRKVGIKTVFRFGRSLSNILCQNKSKIPPNSYPGVYQLECTCGAFNVGETRKKIKTRIAEHQKNVTKANWKASGIVEHAQHCKGDPENFINANSLVTPVHIMPE
ncbi:uncharacterized protein LOC124817506 [Hydra vulgaris]|uniref:uncharacterized protein LOC124817506 n=1 Tax=Hydra vulgaris TaxID=6087 RepID=UPI001F5FEC44|nr:uncharacterized protein LOC124817506 [Hydra vulgaris]